MFSLSDVESASTVRGGHRSPLLPSWKHSAVPSGLSWKQVFSRGTQLTLRGLLDSTETGVMDSDSLRRQDNALNFFIKSIIDHENKSHVRIWNAVDPHLLLIFQVCSSGPLISLLIQEADESSLLISKWTYVSNYSFTLFPPPFDPLLESLGTTDPLPPPPQGCEATGGQMHRCLLGTRE